MNKKVAPVATSYSPAKQVIFAGVNAVEYN
jgi:hypothetical protein